MSKKTDLRYVKTEIAIKEAFYKLIKTDGFSNITVKKIIELANINRSTFYIHYKDVYDLLDQIEEELLNGFVEITKSESINTLLNKHLNWQDIEKFFSIFINYLYDNGELFILLQSEKGDPAFINKFNEMSKSVWKDVNFTDHLSIPQNYALAALTSMLNGLILEWVKSEFNETQEEFMLIVFKIVKDIPTNILN